MQDCEEVREVLGPEGLGPRNANGERLLQFCIQNQLRIEHTFHPHSESRKATWYHPRFGNPGVIDMALVKRTQAKFAADVRALPAVDTCSDHKLCRLKLVQKPDMQWVHRPKTTKAGRPRRLPVDLAGDDLLSVISPLIPVKRLACSDAVSMSAAAGISTLFAEVLMPLMRDSTSWM